jgi:hypothetical protein
MRGFRAPFKKSALSESVELVSILVPEGLPFHLRERGRPGGQIRSPGCLPKKEGQDHMTHPLYTPSPYAHFRARTRKGVEAAVCHDASALHAVSLRALSRAYA